MLSKEQEERKYKNMLTVAKYFTENGGSMIDIESATGISSSSAQRYLRDKELQHLIGKEAFDIIQAKLDQNKKDALSKGGKNYALNNEFTKDEIGQFTGSRKR